MTSRHVIFSVQENQLKRHVHLADGRIYTHSCTRPVFEAVAWLIQEHPETGFSTNELWKLLPGLPFTQINVALAFLTHQGCVNRAGKRSYAASDTLYEDALEAYAYLAEVGT